VRDARGAVPVETPGDLGGRRTDRVVRAGAVDRIRPVGGVPKRIALSGLGVRQANRGWRCTATVDV
jgi:hypothetical protein